jgi:hypothetical protein
VTAALLDDLARDLSEGRVVPWLGPGVHEAPPFPASPAALAGWIAQRAPVPGRIRGNLGSAAQYVEQHSHRRTLERILGEAFARPAAPPPAVELLAMLPRLPLVVDTWYDATCLLALAARRRGVALVHGVDRTGQLERFFADAEAPGLARACPACETLVYQPAGTVWPRPSFVVSDADLVEVLTEIDIQTPIPPEVQRRRTGRRFLFLGQRFTTQLERILARQVAKRSGPGHVAVLPGALAPNEERFLARNAVARVDLPLDAFLAELSARLPRAPTRSGETAVPA